MIDFSEIRTYDSEALQRFIGYIEIQTLKPPQTMSDSHNLLQRSGESTRQVRALQQLTSIDLGPTTNGSSGEYIDTLKWTHKLEVLRIISTHERDLEPIGTALAKDIITMKLLQSLHITGPVSSLTFDVMLKTLPALQQIYLKDVYITDSHLVSLLEANSKGRIRQVVDISGTQGI